MSFVALPTGKPYGRLDKFPLDESSVFATKTLAEDYALNSPIAYPGQLIAETESNGGEGQAYLIGASGNLIPLGGGSGDGGTISGDLSFDNVTLEEDVTLLGTSLGALNDGAMIPEGTTLTTLIKMLTQKRIAAVYASPSVSLSGTGTKTVEVGTSLNPTLTSTFTQNDAGAVETYKVKKNGADVHTDSVVSPYAVAASVIGDETWTFQSNVTYAAGAVKNDNFGEASPTGQIAAGTVNSSNVVYTGKRNTFYGSDADDTAMTTSAEIRALASTALGQVNGDTFTVNVPVGTKRITIAYPATLRNLTKVSYVEQGNANYTDLFVNSSVSVEGVSGFTSADYKVYTYIMAAPTSAAMTFTVQI